MAVVCYDFDAASHVSVKFLHSLSGVWNSEICLDCIAPVSSVAVNVISN